MDNYTFTPKNDVQYVGRSIGAAKTVIASALAAAAIVAGAYISQNPITTAGRARAAAEQQLSDVEMIPVRIDAQHWRQYARQELADAGIELKMTGADPLYQLEHIAEQGNGGARPWAKSAEYHLPDVNGDGTFGGLPSR